MNRDPHTWWQECQERLRVGYWHVGDHVDRRHQYAGLWAIGDALEIRCKLAPQVLTDPDEVAVLRQDTRVAWVLAYCAAHRAGDHIEPVVTWPDLDAVAGAALRTLRDPDSDAHALHGAYRAVARGVRGLGSSSAIADTVAELWRKHRDRLSNAGEDR